MLQVRYLTLVVMLLAFGALMLAGCPKAAAPPPPPATDMSTSPLTSPLTGEPVKIGAIFSLSGTGAPLGTPERDTLVMLEKSINETGGIKGRPLKIIVVDDQTDETAALSAAKQLIESEKVLACIGPSTSPTTLAIMPVFQQAQIPLISCAAAVKITQPVQKFIFSTAQPDVIAVAKLLEHLKSKGLTKLAVLADSNAFGQSGVQALESQIGPAGMSIVIKENFGSKDTSMTTQLTKIKGANPDAIVCWGTNPGPAIVAKNVQELKISMPLFMSHGVSNAKFMELAGPAAEGVIFPSGRILVAEQLPDSDRQKATLLEYTKAFQAAYNGKEPDHFGGHAWDALHMIVAALKGGAADSQQLTEALEQTKDFVGIGGIFNLSPTDHNGLTKDAFVMVTVKDGKWQVVP